MDAERWSGSDESGWTSYIGSPNIRSEISTNCDVYREGSEKSNGKKAIFLLDDDAGDKSDDSMASDASSGPSHDHEAVLLQSENGEGNGSRPSLLRRGDKEDHEHGEYYKCCSGKKVGCRKGKKRDEILRVKEDKEELVQKAESAASQV